MMKKFLFTFILLLVPSLGWAQCNGAFPAFTLCGNSAASPNVPGPLTSPTLSGIIIAPSGNNATVSPIIGRYNPTVTTVLEPFSQFHTNISGTTTGFGSLGLSVLNTFTVDSDNLAAGNFGLYNMYVGSTVGGSNSTGNRTNFQAFIAVTSATGNVNPNPYFYVAGAATAVATTNDGGTGLSASGNLFAHNSVATLLTGATFWSSLVGDEIDCEAQSGTSVAYRQCLKIVSFGTSSVVGSVSDYALGIVKQNTATLGFSMGITFGEPTGYWPIPTTGTMIGTQSGLGGGPAYQALNGVDFSAVTFQTNGCGFKSIGFCVNPSGSTAITPTMAANTSIDGLILSDATAATSGNQQFSPRLHLSGQGWKTNSTAASQAVDWIAEVQPIQGTASPTSNLVFSAQTNGGGYSTKASFSDGSITAGFTQLSLNGASGSTYGLSVNGVEAGRFTSQAGSVVIQAEGGNSIVLGNLSINYMIINSSGLIQIPQIATGTPVAALCIDASNNIIKKVGTSC